MLHALLEQHSKVFIQWEKPFRLIDKVLNCQIASLRDSTVPTQAASQVSKSKACGGDNWQDTPIEKVDEALARHNGVLIVLLRFNNVASAISTFKFRANQNRRSVPIDEFVRKVRLFHRSRENLIRSLERTVSPTHIIIYEHFCKHTNVTLAAVHQHLCLPPEAARGQVRTKSSSIGDRIDFAPLLTKIEASDDLQRDPAFADFASKFDGSWSFDSFAWFRKFCVEHPRRAPMSFANASCDLWPK